MPRGFLSRNERRSKYARRVALKLPQSRTRSRDLRVTISGTYTPPLPQVPVQGTANVGVREDCEDIVYNFEAVNPFSMYTREEHYPVLNGYRLSGSTVIRSFTDFPVGYKPGAADPRSVYPALLPTEISDLAWSTLAATNPNKPQVEVPSFVGELKDFFQLIRGRGEHLIKQAAQGYIAWRWVLRPLWSDLQKMLKFQSAVNQYAEMLHNLQNGKVMRKRVTLRKRSTTGTPSNVTIHSTGATFSGKSRVDGSEEVWGTANWKLAPLTRLPRLMKLKSREWLESHSQRGWLENEKFLNALASGTAEWSQKGILSHDALATAWELCPWSWLIDWATNYGDIIAATRNAIPVTYSNVAIMRKTIAIRRFYDIGTDPTWALLTMKGTYLETATRKERYRPVLLPFSLPCFMPLIQGGHWQILAALAVTSGRLPRS
jgi:hypothetical protein